MLKDEVASVPFKFLDIDLNAPADPKPVKSDTATNADKKKNKSGAVQDKKKEGVAQTADTSGDKKGKEGKKEKAPKAAKEATPVAGNLFYCYFVKVNL